MTTVDEGLLEYPKIQPYQYKAKVLRVVDADTMDMEVDLGFSIRINQRFRVDGYDAPETWRPRNEAEREHGERATARAIELLMDKEIHIQSSKVAGIYGRYGAIIFLEDGRIFSEVMINEGFEKQDNYDYQSNKK
jgi:micrococcal nuclease